VRLYTKKRSVSLMSLEQELEEALRQATEKEGAFSVVSQ
jgi:hypothetical protein